MILFVIVAPNGLMIGGRTSIYVFPLLPLKILLVLFDNLAYIGYTVSIKVLRGCRLCRNLKCLLAVLTVVLFSSIFIGLLFLTVLDLRLFLGALLLKKLLAMFLLKSLSRQNAARKTFLIGGQKMKSKRIFVLRLIPFGFLGSVYKCPVLSGKFDVSDGSWSLKYLRPDGVHRYIYYDFGEVPIRPLNLFYCDVATERGNRHCIYLFRRGAIDFVRSSWRNWRRTLRRLSVPDIDDFDDIPF